MWLRGTPILCYHAISGDGAAGRSEFTVAASSLDRQMRLLRRLGFRSFTLQELTRAYEHGEPVRNGVVLTFDDGYRDACTLAAPILRSHGFRGTLFVVTEYVGRDLRNDGVARFATWDEIRRVHDEGWEIGLHTATHADLGAGAVDNGTLARELLDAARVLEHQLGAPVWSVAYPWGRYTPAAVDAVVECGARTAVTVSRSLATRRSPRYALPRCPVRRNDNLLDFLSTVTTGYGPKSLVRLLRREDRWLRLRISATPEQTSEESAWWRP
jgi:peptidoglycan/xylan/chitin deacetylase (PgdA/CDA1 family)